MRIIGWNVENTHEPAAVRAELAKLIDAHHPDVICLQETYHLHDKLDRLGYQVIQYRPRKGESERAEVAILVRNGLKIKRGLRIRLAKVWRGAKLGKRHDPRVYRWTRVVKDGVTYKIGSIHQPFGQSPKAESVAAVQSWFDATPETRPTLMVGDWNMTKAVVGKRLHGVDVAGVGIDLAAIRNADVAVTRLGKHGSDHHAIRYDTKALASKKPKAAREAVSVMGAKAIAAAQYQSKHGPAFAYGMCLQRVRLAFGIGAKASDAIGAWNAAQHKHRESNPAKIPAGYPVFWSGGSSGHGHIAISAGHGMCWSTDIRRGGYFDLVPIATIHAQWGLTLLGYTTDLNGVTIS